MNKEKIRTIVDYIPLIIIICYALVMLYNAFIGGGHEFGIKNANAIVLLIATIVILRKDHKKGVLALGLYMILGFWRVHSFYPSNQSVSFGLGLGALSLKLPANPFYLLLFIFHFIVSHHWYYGVLSKKYWTELFQKPASPAE